MKIAFVILSLTLAVTIISCSHKTTPPATQTSTTTSASPAADVVAGKQTYVAKCARCHELKNPANFTSDEWIPLVNSMSVKAQLTDAEKANVLAYVQANAKQG